jgi:GT2 family glycosyltransferase
VRFSIVIPTYQRSGILGLTLKGLALQEEAPEFEVIVVDDGSRDETPSRVTRLQSDFPVPLHYLFQPNRKQGAARNLGARSAVGDRLLFLGDDIVPSPRFLKEHEACRMLHRDDPRIVVIGYTTWPESFRRTRFLDYIGEQGWQFGFSLIDDADNVPFNFFYTSNLSVSRRFFLESGGFDEDFQEYGWEDMELSLRLQDRGMRLVYAPKAKAFHHHPTDLKSFIRRQKQVGRSAWNFFLKHPEMGKFLNVGRVPDYGGWDQFRMALLTRACRLFEFANWPDLSGCYPDLMSYYYLRGLCKGREDQVTKTRTANAGGRT